MRDPRRAVDAHVADALSGLAVPELAAAGRVADIGAGAGVPGLVLAAARPQLHVTEVESVGRKCAFLERAIAAMGLANADVACARAEAWAAGREACDAVTARALAPLPVLVEYAAPLLRPGGVLVAWKGTPDAAERADGDAAARAAGARARPRRGHAAVPGGRPAQPPRLPEGWFARRTDIRGGRELPANGPSVGRPEPEGRGSVPKHRGPSDRVGRYRRRTDGHHLRDRQPEGRGRQDHHGGQRRRLHRGGGLPDAAGRHRPAGQRHASVSACPRTRRPTSTTCSPARATAEEAIRPSDVTGLSLLPSHPDLAAASVELPRSAGSEGILREALAPVRERFAYTLLDCPPSIGPLTVNALVAADRVIVPVQTEYFALEGLAGLLDTLALIQRELNPGLTVAGMLLTMHDGRTRLARDVEREVREHFPSLVFDTVIPRNVRVGEAPSFGRPVIHHDPHCPGADAYFELAKEVAARG